jgi:hypothetical protein
MFIDKSSRVDREALQSYTLQKLVEIGEKVSYLANNEPYRQFWLAAHDRIGGYSEAERAELLRIESQITHLSELVQSWINMSVESPERFECFITSKAKEINSGDEKRDYFWALQIRHDQLVAVVRVMETLIGHMQRWVEGEVESMLGDGVFLGLGKYGIDDQIYLEAEKVKQERDLMI